MSPRALRKATKTARKLKDMPETRKALARGEITEEHADAAADCRSVRLATDDQWAQLIVRDGGRVGCGASPAHCEAHHGDYWEDLGPTDIENLVLLCSGDHHLVHDGSHVLVRESDGWKLVRRSAQRRSLAQAA